VIRLLADQNFNQHIANGLVQRLSDLDLQHARDVGLAEASDPDILEWTAANERILLTHDRRTIPKYAYERVRARQPMPGVFVVSTSLSVGQAIDELLLAVECLSAEECTDVVRYFPLQRFFALSFVAR
jgi:hypothetical protein